MQAHSDWVFGVAWITDRLIATGRRFGCRMPNVACHGLSLSQPHLPTSSKVNQPDDTCGAQCKLTHTRSTVSQLLLRAGSRDHTVKLWQLDADVADGRTATHTAPRMSSSHHKVDRSYGADAPCGAF